MSNLELKQDSCVACGAGSTHERVENRPGLPALSYRIGTQASLLRQMKARLPHVTIPDGPSAATRPLAALTTRQTVDPAIALLDAWAMVGDVLTFYQERIANEGYLRTATERRSVLELARAIGYELNPGIAASTYLAFTLEEAPGAPKVVTIPTGTRVQSVPAPGKMPQTFETVSSIEAHVEWNAMRSVSLLPEVAKPGLTDLYVKGISIRLQPGDAILFVGEDRVQNPNSSAWAHRILTGVEVDATKGQTRVTWATPLGIQVPIGAKVFALRQRAGFFGYNAPDWYSMPTSFQTQYANAHKGIAEDGWPNFYIDKSLAQIVLDGSFGVVPGSWTVVVHETPGGQGLIWSSSLFRAQESWTFSKAEYALSGKVTAIRLDQGLNAHDPGMVLIRRHGEVVYTNSEPLALGERPYGWHDPEGAYAPIPLWGAGIPLAAQVPELAPGQSVTVTGKRIRLRYRGGTYWVTGNAVPIILTPGDLLLTRSAPTVYPNLTWTWAVRNEHGDEFTVTGALDVLELAPAAADDEAVSEWGLVKAMTWLGTAWIILERPLLSAYDPATVTINANVALVTHGETVSERLASGDASKTNQRFTLKRAPLTYTSAATASGAEAAILVTVVGEAWTEEETLSGLDGKDRSYSLRLTDEGTSVITFGDGLQGARLPTGQENVVATYRTGSGLDGNVAADSVTLLVTRPAGVRGVTNPLPATGGADPESVDLARVNAPLKVLTLDRVVSPSDYEDFARAFAGIAKASVTEIWTGGQRIIHLTLADAESKPLPSNSVIAQNLLAALRQYGDPTQQVGLAGYQPRSFGASLRVTVARGQDPAVVLQSVQQAVESAFSVASRSLGQPVTGTALMAVAQGAPGVVGVELLELWRDGQKSTGVPTMLPAQRARWIDRVILPAELLVLNPASLKLQAGVSEL